jgi:UrcA family protein
MNILNTLSAMGALAMAATPLVAIGSAAHAAETGPRPAYIRVADLDLSRPADVVVFKARVDAAASRFCSQNMTSTDLATLDSCRAAIRQEAAEKLGSDQRDAMKTAAADVAWQVAGR